MYIYILYTMHNNKQPYLHWQVSKIANQSSKSMLNSWFWTSKCCLPPTLQWIDIVSACFIICLAFCRTWHLVLIFDTDTNRLFSFYHVLWPWHWHSQGLAIPIHTRFGYFGVKLLLDASTMPDDGSILAEEKEEAEEAVNAAWWCEMMRRASLIHVFFFKSFN